jgi:tetratricopeptide (TPR) repeat protein
LAYTDKREYERATTDFGVVLQVNPRNALALYARGMMFLKEGDAEAATADIEAAKAINPNIATIAMSRTVRARLRAVMLEQARMTKPRHRHPHRVGVY